MSVFTSLKNSFLFTMELRGRRVAQQELLKLSDRQLEDFGISRYLLTEGVSAWPWKAESDVEAAFSSVKNTSAISVSDNAVDELMQVPGIMQDVPATRKSTEIKRAINELNAYSDRELAELGVTRNGIEEAVRFGRQNIEGVNEQQRQVA